MSYTNHVRPWSWLLLRRDGGGSCKLEVVNGVDYLKSLMALETCLSPHTARTIGPGRGGAVAQACDPGINGGIQFTTDFR